MLNVVRAGMIGLVSVAVAFSASKPPPREMSVTLEDGRVVALNNDSTYTFKDGSVLAEDGAAISMVLNDGRTLLIKPDGTWALGRGLKAEAPRTVAVPTEALTAKTTLDKGSLPKSIQAAQAGVLSTITDKLARQITHPKVTRAMIADCARRSIPENGIVTTVGKKTEVTAEVNFSFDELAKLKGCLEDAVAEAAAIADSLKKVADEKKAAAGKK